MFDKIKSTLGFTKKPEQVENFSASHNLEQKPSQTPQKETSTSTKYCGVNRVKAVLPIPESPKESMIHLETGEVFRIPNLIKNQMLTDKPDKNNEGNHWRSMKIAAIANDFISLLRKEYCLVFGDVEALAQALVNLSKNELIIANKIKWGKWDHNITIDEIFDVARKDYDKYAEITAEARRDYLSNRVGQNTVHRG